MCVDGVYTTWYIGTYIEARYQTHAHMQALAYICDTTIVARNVAEISQAYLTYLLFQHLLCPRRPLRSFPAYCAPCRQQLVVGPCRRVIACNKDPLVSWTAHGRESVVKRLGLDANPLCRAVCVSQQDHWSRWPRHTNSIWQAMQHMHRINGGCTVGAAWAQLHRVGFCSRTNTVCKAPFVDTAC
jgi:hypothetical protein